MIKGVSMSTYSDENAKKYELGEPEDQEDTQSLTASDFECLNSENFYDKINDAFVKCGK